MREVLRNAGDSVRCVENPKRLESVANLRDERLNVDGPYGISPILAFDDDSSGEEWQTAGV